MRKRKIWIWSAVFLLMWSLFLIYGGRFLIYRHITPSEGRTLIVPLMGSMPDRSREAASQFSEIEDAELLFVSPIDPEKYFMDSLGMPIASTAENFSRVMVRLGIPQEKLHYLRGPATNTVDEADLVARYLRQDSSVKRVVVVSSSFHTRRAYQIFRDRFKKAGVSATINIAPSRYTDFNPEYWYRRKQDAVFVVTEWLKILYYLLIGQFQ